MIILKIRNVILFIFNDKLLSKQVKYPFKKTMYRYFCFWLLPFWDALFLSQGKIYIFRISINFNFCGSHHDLFQKILTLEC